MKSCETIGQIASETHTHAVEVEPTTGIEPNLKEFAHIQIGLNPPLESGRGCMYAMFLNSPLYSECWLTRVEVSIFYFDSSELINEPIQ